MSKRESFLLRIDPELLGAIKSWAEAELRSTNAHMEYLLRDCLVKANRLPIKKNAESRKESEHDK